MTWRRRKSRAIGLKSGEADKQKEEERTRQKPSKKFG
jgi:hypothetical protein